MGNWGLKFNIGIGDWGLEVGIELEIGGWDSY